MLPLRRQARLVASLVPRSEWYRVAVLASRAQGRLRASLGGNGRLTEAVMLDNWLRELTLCGAFPIPMRCWGTDVLTRPNPSQGVLYCWTHLPLFEIPLRALVQLGHQPDCVVAHPGKISPGEGFVVPGLQERIPALSVERRVLIRVRNALKAGQSVACLADAEMFGPLSPVVLRLVGKVGARLIFQWAKQAPDGTIDVWFIEAPRPACEDEEAVQINLEFLRSANHEKLAELGVGDLAAAKPDPQPEPQI